MANLILCSSTKENVEFYSWGRIAPCRIQAWGELESLNGHQSDHEPARHPGSEEQQLLGLCQAEYQQRVWGGDPSSLLWTAETHQECSGSPVQERHGLTGESPAKGHKDC